MATVTESLDAAIESWCRLKPNQYGVNDPLATLWSKGGQPGGYDPQGILQLLDCLYRRKRFRECEWALNMTTGMFRQGGGLQTYKDLFVHLENC